MNKKGLMIIELMITVSIISILLAFFAPKYRSIQDKAKYNQCFATRKSLERAQQVYMLENDNKTISSEELYLKGYIDKRPKCSAGGTLVWISTSPLKVACSVHDIAYPVSPGPAHYYASGFNDMSGLKIIAGSWYSKDGYLWNSSYYSGQIFVSTAALKDYSISLNANLLKGNGYGVYYRASLDSSNRVSGYCFQYDPGLGNKFVVRKVTNGTESAPIASYSMPSGYPVYNAFHNIKIETAGEHTAVYVDDKKILDFKDSSYLEGITGIRNWSGYSQFDSIEINKI